MITAGTTTFSADSSALLHEVPAELVETILSQCPRRQIASNTLLLHPDQMNESLYLILQGTLQIRLAAVPQQRVTDLHPGDCVGEMSLLEHTSPSALVVALEPTEVLEINQALFWDLAESCHTLARNLLQILSGRLRHGNHLLAQNLQAQERYRQDAHLDPLTGLYNRRWLDREFPLALESTRLQQSTCSLLVLDVDKFKDYNDDNGHPAGDRALQQLADSLRQQIRASDLLSRYGGEEFLILLPNTPRHAARQIAARICQHVAALKILDCDGTSLPGLTLSIGLADYQPDDTWNSLLKRADRALYQAKREGRNRYAG